MPDAGRRVPAGELAETRYFDRNLDCDAVKILPGEYYVTSMDMVLVAVLGTCVAACVRDRERLIGGMNHFMLPGDGVPEQAAAHGHGVMNELIECLLDMGARRECLEAKLFGGGGLSNGASGASLGDRHARFADAYLRGAGIPVLGGDLCGAHARKVYFFPYSGRVLVRRILRLRNDTLIRRERDYAARLDGEEPGISSGRHL